MTVLEEMKLELQEVKGKILKDLDVPEKVNMLLYQRHLAEESLLNKYIAKLENQIN